MAHECINCSSDCYCRGDIDDHHTGDDAGCIGCGCDEDGLNEPADSDDEYVSVFGHPESATWVCRECGCRNDRACIHPMFGACWWIEPNLCCHCVELKGDPAVQRPWQTNNPA